MFPAVSIMCPTYGRFSCLQECVESFLKQDYMGSIEIIIGNDCIEQHIEQFDDPRVRVINYLSRFPSLLAKREVMMQEAHHPNVMFWDSDDIYLPVHIRRCVERSEFKDAWRHPFMWVDFSGTLLVKKQATPLGSLIVSKQAYERVGGFKGYLPDESRSKNPGSGTDLVNALACHHCLQESPAIYKDVCPTWVYRRDSVPFHVSNIHTFKNNGIEKIPEQGYAQVEGSISEALELGNEPAGILHLTPTWSRDWTSFAKKSATAIGLDYAQEYHRE